MAEYDENEDKQTDGKGLRAQLEAALAELKTAKETLGQTQAQIRTVNLEAVLKAKGVERPGIAKWYPSGADTSKDAIEKWLAENAEDFGIQLKTDGEQPAEQAAPVVPDRPEVAQAYKQIQRAQGSALPSAAQGLEGLEQQLKNATSMDDLTNLLGSLGSG